MSERLEAMKRYADEYPDNPFPRYALALEYRKAGMEPEAEQTLRDLTARAPDHVPGWHQLALLLEDLGRAQEAAEAAARALALARRQGNAHMASQIEQVLERVG